jgi:hypothetical protein
MIKNYKVCLDVEKIMNKFKLFWQYPVITEETFYKQNKYNPNYVGLPWATIIDKKYNISVIAKLLFPLMGKRFGNITCCQHISFRNLIGLFNVLHITTVYTPHKQKGEDMIDGIKILPCPLYAVNIEDETRNEEFQNIDYTNIKRDILYGFAGGYDSRWYMSDTRNRIFKMKHSADTFVSNTGNWHFDNVVYNLDNQNIKKTLSKTEMGEKNRLNYNMLLLKSRFSLCPSGSGPNSIRLWESLAVGSIPILLSDKLELPSHPLWEDSIVFLKEDKLNDLRDVLEKISPEREREMRLNCIKIYNYFKNNYSNQSKTIVHYCCGSYFTGHIGGVARYDYQLSLAVPTRVFFQGPQQKNGMLLFLKNNPESLVITDNHLACDIPNDYNVILVHHGVAQTHAEREPDWNEYWKNHCCEGQKKMLYERDPIKTKILSISQFCTDEFTKYYGDDYLKFRREKMYHPSELDEKKFKQFWGKTPIVLGNWANKNKGSDIVNKLKKYKTFRFEKLKIQPDGWEFGDFNRKKQDIYLRSDIFLQISLCEGNSYASLDALMMGLPVVASNVGLFYKDIPEDCFVKIDWERNDDLGYIKEKLDYAWKNREELGRKSREWYLQNCSFNVWEKKMNRYINDYELILERKRINEIHNIKLEVTEI